MTSFLFSLPLVLAVETSLVTPVSDTLRTDSTAPAKTDTLVAKPRKKPTQSASATPPAATRAAPAPATRDNAKPAATARAVAPPLPKPSQKARQADTTQDKTSQRVKTQLETGAVITFDGVLFDYDKAELKPAARPIIRAIATALKANPNLRVTIAGHTDARGSHSYNQRLSRARANTVATALSRLGVPGNRFEVRAFGENRPAASNATAAGRAKNRRVEVYRIGI